MKTTFEHENSKHEPTSCEHCPQSISCSNLFTALQVLSKLADNCQDAGALFQYEDFKRRLEHLKFRFPDGQQSCLITHNNELARELVQESIRLIDALNQKVVS
ncbi:MAG: hypothetical protein ACOH5I_07340 [Oligoflexus sp.]